MCVTTKYIGKKKNLERIVGSCSELGFIERDWSLFLVNVHPGVSVHYKHSLATSSLFKTWTVHFSSRYVCKWHVLWLLSERSTGQGFTELCNRGPSVLHFTSEQINCGIYWQPVCKWHSQRPHSMLQCNSYAIPFHWWNKQINQRGKACLRDKPFAMTEQRGR